MALIILLIILNVLLTHVSYYYRRKYLKELDRVTWLERWYRIYKISLNSTYGRVPRDSTFREIKVIDDTEFFKKDIK